MAPLFAWCFLLLFCLQPQHWERPQLTDVFLLERTGIDFDFMKGF